MGAGTPSKKRKLNDSKSPAVARGLDYFFGKQKQNAPTQRSNGVEVTATQGGEGTELTDEQLARKLQAEWDREEAREVKKDLDISEADQTSVPANGEASNNANPQKHLSKVEDEEARETNRQPFSFDTKSKNTLSLQSAGSAEDTISSKIPFDESPLTFDPAKYVPELQSHWAAEGGDASYALLTRCFVLVNSTQSRIKIVDTLVNLLRVIIEGDPSSLLPAVGLHLPLLPPFLKFALSFLKFLSIILNIIVTRIRCLRQLHLT